MDIGIQHFPLELLRKIVCYCAAVTHKGVHTYIKPRLASIRLVCKPFNFAAEPFLFSEVKLEFQKGDPEGVQTYLQALANGTHPSCRYANTLEILSLPIHDVPLVDAAKDLNALIGSLMVKAIQSLEHIRTVHWDIRSSDYLYLITEGLSTLPHLQKLYLNFVDIPSDWQVPNVIPLRRFKHLRGIDISGPSLSQDSASDFANQLRAMFRDGRSLDSLSLTFPLSMDFEDSEEEAQHVLHTILQDIPEKSPLQIQHLKLDQYALKLDSVTLPHLRNLSSLDVSQTLDADPEEDHKDLWQGLTSASIHLKDLVVIEPSSYLYDYLKSYTGLENLTFLQAHPALGVPEVLADQPAAQQEANRLTRELFTAVLPLHKEHLLSFRSLNILDYQAPSCMTYADMVSLSVCQKLHTLAFTLQASELTKETPSKDITKLLETALLLPRITLIELSYSLSRFMPLHRVILAFEKNMSMEIYNAFSVMNIIASVQIGNGALHRGNGFCEVMFKDNRYLPYRTEDGSMTLRVDDHYSDE